MVASRMLFLDKYDNPKNIRFSSFEFSLKEAFKRNSKIIVETGVYRGKQKFIFFSKINWLDGMSTLIFSEYAKYVGGHLHACDINAKNIKNAKKFTSEFKQHITFHLDDSVSFLRNFEKEIDFLYLDSLDGQHPGSSEHQLNEIKNSLKNLHKNSLILLDDKGQKTNLSINYMLDNGMKVINETKQQILLSFK